MSMNIEVKIGDIVKKKDTNKDNKEYIILNKWEKNGQTYYTLRGDNDWFATDVLEEDFENKYIKKRVNQVNVEDFNKKYPELEEMKINLGVANKYGGKRKSRKQKKSLKRKSRKARKSNKRRR